MINHEQLPLTVLDSLNFDEVYSLRPDKKSKIILYDKDAKEFRDRQIFRSYMSYGHTPDFNPEVKKSYMFLNKSEETPEIFKNLHEYVRSIDPRFNQMVVNWYEADEYIELHRDCTSAMVSEDAPILMVNLNESDDLYKMRSFHMVSLDGADIGSVPLRNGYLYHITNNNTHRHFTGKGVERRVSITFRMMKD